MTPDQYVQDAIRTESQVEQIQFSLATRNFFVDVVDAMISLGTILDQFKKNAFYGKPFDLDKIKALAAQASLDMEGIKVDLVNGNFPNNDKLYPLEVNPRVFHAIVGVMTESVELLEAMDIDSNKIDNVNLLEEFGDLNWYQAIGIDQAGGSFEQVLERNIAKLRARYPNKFTSEAAINRDVVAERKILEGQSSSNIDTK